MLDELSLEFKDDHIYILHGAGFEINAESMGGLWELLAAECARHDCSNILIEANAPKRSMDTVSAFTSGVNASGVTRNLWLALCFHDYEPDELSELFRHAARNRGANVEFFADCEKALGWLRVNNPQF